VRPGRQGMRRRKLVATAGILSATAFAATVAIGANIGLVNQAEPSSPVGQLDDHHEVSVASAVRWWAADRCDGASTLRHGKLDHFDGEIVATKSVNEAGGRGHAELRDDVGLHGGRSGGGEGEDRNRIGTIAERGQILAEHPVVGAKIVTPLGDAVGLINGDERWRPFGQHLGEAGNAKAFGSDEEEVELAFEIERTSTSRGQTIAAGVNDRNAARQPIARPAAITLATRNRPAAGRMKRLDSKLSAIVACSWMPGMVPMSAPNGVANASIRPDVVSPTNTILSLKIAGSIFGGSPESRLPIDAKRSRTSNVL